jgi:lipid II:glycine glycyltransferase (peptidoglycan interpeptide bridge formation enzyme)
MINSNFDTNIFLQTNSPDGGFLQSESWRMFQEKFGRKTIHFEGRGFWANVIEHTLLGVGKYWYVPRGPVFDRHYDKEIIKKLLEELILLAKKNKVAWLRIEPASEEKFELIKQFAGHEISKAPRDMQPREIFIVDITKSEEQLLSEMKEKTRYNIRLAEKKGVKIIGTENKEEIIGNKYVDEFLRLTAVMAKRNKIGTHPAIYYRQMIESIPRENLKIYVAEYQGKIIAASLVIFFERMATYFHGASDDAHRNVMAPYLLQWRAIQDAKALGCESYDLGGIDTKSEKKSWEGITRFKWGFSLVTKSVTFPGSNDIVLSQIKYRIYKTLQKIKRFL